jgi:hypothetical protein
VLAGQELVAEPVEGAHPAGGTLAHRLPQIDRIDPGLDAHREDFGQRHPENGTCAVVHELGNRAGADRPDIGRLVTHRVEHRLVTVEDLLIAADPDRHFAAGRTARAAADRRIEHVEVLLGEDGVDLAHRRHRVGRHVEERGVGAHALDQSVGPERHLLDIGRHRQRGKNDLGLLADLLWRIGPDGTLGQERLGRRTAQIVHDKLVPGLLQIGRHAFAHHAEADKPYAHLSPPPIAIPL